MKAFLCIITFCFATFAHSQLLEVKPNRTAIVKDGPFGNAPQIASLTSGTRVTKLGTAPNYYSIQLANGSAGWSYKGNFIEVQGTSPTPITPATVTADSLLARSDVLKIIIIDVEVGDATLIICPEEDGKRDVILIDAGENDGERIRQELIKCGFTLTGRPINRFFATHYHLDHIGGVPQIATLIEIAYDHGSNKETTKYKTALTSANVDRRTIALTYQETFSGGVSLDCVAANRATATTTTTTPHSSDENRNSIALQLRFAGFDYFTGGDLTSEVENALVGTVRNCDVYHANHHGSSDTSSSQSFVQALDPEVSIASNGTKHGHPNSGTATRLTSAPISSRFYQTNRNTDNRANQPDPKFVADDTFFQDTAIENNEGARGNITVVVDPVTNQYYVIMPGLPLSEATFAIEP